MLFKIKIILLSFVCLAKNAFFKKEGQKSEKAPDGEFPGLGLFSYKKLLMTCFSQNYFLRETAAAVATETTARAATTPTTDSAPVLGFASPTSAAGTSRTSLY